jgi:ketosteroid isomerase-like protein
MMIRSACRALLLAIALALPAGPAPAEDAPSTLAAPDQAAIRQVIQAQLDAFQRDDAEAAYSYATPTIREKFGGAANFLQMVKTGYTPVYRPQSVTFAKLVDTAYGPDQILRLIGPDGVTYTAHYMMQKQPDGSWMINGCFLTRAEDRSV